MIDAIFYIFLFIFLNFNTRHAGLLTALFILFVHINKAQAQFLLEILERTPNNNHRPVVRCDATGAHFGDDVMAFSFGLTSVGCAIPTIPECACSDNVTMPHINKTGCITNFALVPRGNCSFSEKAFFVQNAVPAYEALIVYNYKGQTSPITMHGSKFADDVKIPVIMVNYACKESLMGRYSAENGYVVTLRVSPGYYDLIKYLVPFVVIVAFCFLVLFISLIIRLCRERRRLAKKRLSRSNLKKIPTRKYKKGDREDTCAICLEDFIEGDKLRILPCRHAYHCKCIDPWLTKNRKVCPVCKRKVGPRSGSDSSDSDSERASTSAVGTTRENDPLLRNEQPMATNSSAEFPYPSNPLMSRSSNEANDGSAFSRAASLLNFSRIFYSDRAATMSAESVEAPENSASSSMATNIEQPHRSYRSTVLGRLRERASRFAHLLRRENANNDMPHSRLVNEDTSTVSNNTDGEFETNQPGWYSDNFSDSLADANSLTTVCSNRNIANNPIQDNVPVQHHIEEDSQYTLNNTSMNQNIV